MVRQTTKVIVLEILGVISLLLMASVAILAIMLASGPVEIGMFRDDVERAITDSRDGREVTVERLTLQWSPSERRLFVVASDLSLKDETGVEAGYAKRADLTLDAGDLLRGRVEILQARIAEGWMEARNIGPNQWTLAGDPVPEIKAGILPQTPQEWLARINQVMSDVLGGLEASEELFRIEVMELTEMEVRIVGADGELISAVEDTSGKIERSENDIELRLAGAGGGVGLPGRFETTISTSDAYQAIRADLTIQDLPLADLATRFGFEQFEEEAFSLDITFAAGLTRADGLQQVGIAVDRESGDLPLAPLGDTLRDIDLQLTYQPANDAIIFDQVTLQTDRVETVFNGRLTNVLAENVLRRIELNADELGLDLTPRFPTAWTFEDVSLSADIADDFSILSFDRLEAGFGGATIKATGAADFRPDREEGELPISLDLTTEVIGELSKDQVLNLWPETLGRGARRFVEARIDNITVTEASASLALRPDSLAEGYLRDGDLGVSFGFKDAAVRFLDDVPPVENAVGSGRMSGNSFGATILSATYSDWEIDRGTVDFPKFNPRGERFTVAAQGRGPAVSILRVLSESRLKLQENTGFDPERLSGDADAVFFMSRPALSNVPYEELEIEVTGKIRDAGLKQAALGIDLTNSSVDVTMTDNTLVLSGFGDLGPAPIQFTWRDQFGEGTEDADLSASAIITPDVLNEFGLVGRAYLSGEIPVNMQGKVSSDGLGAADFGFDLREARIDVGEIGWIKPAGEAARANLSYTGDGLQQASALRIDSDTAKLDGDILLARDGRLQSLTLRELWVEDKADVAGAIRRKADGTAEINLTGAYLDLSGALGDVSALGSVGSGPGLPLQFNATVERLRLRRGLDLTDARLTLDSSEGFLRFVDAAGTIAGGKALNATYESEGPRSAPRISLTTGDAGFIAEAFLGFDFITGGALDLTGTLASGNTPARLRAVVRGARLADAPFVTQILSLASLRGLADTLSGDGVLFSEIDIPVTIGGGRYVIDGGRASGPALGLTVNGWIGTDAKAINLDGVLVPSFGVNSMLGGVPIIGDLFVGREGEGIFSITYSVRGSLEKAQVSVNPLSAVTPGILRRIFENPSDTSIPATLDVDPNLRPPQPKLPELPEDEVLGETPGGG